MKLIGKTAIVTGGGRGIGKGIALKLASEGADVGIADLNLEDAKTTCEEIEAMGRKALPFQLDISNGGQVKEWIKVVYANFGKVDILVNNAGWDKIEPFLESKEETWDRVIAINYKGHILCTRAVLDDMIARKYGKIINIGSDAGRTGSTGEVVYSGTKGAVIAFSKALAREMARYRINVNVVCPGPSNTPLMATLRAENPKLIDSLIRNIPLRRLGEPQDLANAVAFLASDEAEFITGQTLSVSGGLTMM